MKINRSRVLDTEPQPLFPMALGIERRKRESLRGNYIDAWNLFRDGWKMGFGPLAFVLRAYVFMKTSTSAAPVSGLLLLLFMGRHERKE